MRILVAGAGAMGSLFAALLAKSGADVSVLAKSEETAEKIRSKGISVEGVSGSWQAKVKATADPQQAGDCDLVVVCVKSYDTRSVAKAVKSAVGEQTYVLTLQNGMGNAEVLQDAVGAEKIICGVTNMGATLIETGKVRHAGKGETVIGRLDGRIPVVMRSIRESFNRAAIETRIARDIRGALWSKLVINAGINPLSALTRLCNGKLGECEQTRVLMRQAVAEGVRLAKRKKIRLVYEDPLAKAEAVCEATSGNLSSMLQDVLRKRRTEIESINGFIVRQGQELGIPVPVNTVLCDLIRTIESSYDAAVIR